MKKHRRQLSGNLTKPKKEFGSPEKRQLGKFSSHFTSTRKGKGQVLANQPIISGSLNYMKEKAQTTKNSEVRKKHKTFKFS